MNKNKLPPEWIDRIFMRLHGRFGNAFLDKYRIGQTGLNGEDVGVLNAKQVWAEDCGHLSAERIGKGLEAKYEYAPSCDDFISQCKSTAEMHKDHELLKLGHIRDAEKDKAGLKKIDKFVEENTKSKTDYKAWAKRIVANPKNFPDQSLIFAKEALAS